MELGTLLAFTKRVGASDLHISAGAPPMVRIQGNMRHLALPDLREDDPLPAREVETMVFAVLTESQQKRLEEEHELDFSLQLGDVGRFRGNVLYQSRGLAAVFRVIPDKIPSFDDLGLPETVRALAERDKGLVLVTGPTGSGKSTTLAAMVDFVNRSRGGHIITIEDPIEFVHAPKKCMVNQREVGPNTKSFANALRAALREDPDVILVGEMRDRETIALAITAAETGHLVFGTLHTNSATKTIDRILNVFPAGEMEQVRAMLSESLQAVVAQLLLPRRGGSGRVAAHEILIGTSAVRAMIRDGRTHTLGNAIQTGQRHGMQSLEQALTRLAGEGLVEASVVQDVLTGGGEVPPAGALAQDRPAAQPLPSMTPPQRPPAPALNRPAASPLSPPRIAPAAAAVAQRPAVPGDGTRVGSKYKYS